MSKSQSEWKIIHFEVKWICQKKKTTFTKVHALYFNEGLQNKLAWKFAIELKIRSQFIQRTLVYFQ